MERKWIDEAGGSSWLRSPVPGPKRFPSAPSAPAVKSDEQMAELQARLAASLDKLRTIGEEERAEAEARLEERRRQLEEVEQVEARVRSLVAEGHDPDGHVRISLSGGETASTVTISEELARTGDAGAITRAVSLALRAAQTQLRRSSLTEWARAGADAPPDSPLAEVSRSARERLDELSDDASALDAVGSDHLRVDAQRALGNAGPDHEPDRSMGAGPTTGRRSPPRLV